MRTVDEGPTAQRRGTRLAGALLRTQPDARLIELARGGGGPAFEELVRRHRRALVCFAGRIASPSRADDVVQEGTLKAFVALRNGAAVEAPRAWLYGIVRNCAIDSLRGERSHEQIDENFDGVEQPPQAAERREQVAGLIAAVEALPGAQREAIVQRELEGRGHSEIATALGVSPGAVRQLIFRARTTLRAGFGALLPAQLLRGLALSGSADTAVGGAAGAGLGISAAKLGLGAVLATSAVIGGVNVSRTVDLAAPSGSPIAVASADAETTASPAGHPSREPRVRERSAASRAPGRPDGGNGYRRRDRGNPGPDPSRPHSGSNPLSPPPQRQQPSGRDCDGDNGGQPGSAPASTDGSDQAAAQRSPAPQQQPQQQAPQQGNTQPAGGSAPPA